MKSKLTEKARQKMRENWLAQQGSRLETQMIDSLLTNTELTPDETNMLLKYRKTRDSRDMHFNGFWQTAKKLRIGGHNFDLAMSRHKKLKGKRWLVAYCIANSEGKTLQEIGEKLGISVDGVKYHKQKISVIISKEYGHELEGMADDAQITRWFLGS
ncbi:MAG: hypothetical protein WBM24_17420 [Candidatus Sulfotelmatobacter sp.]